MFYIDFHISKIEAAIRHTEHTESEIKKIRENMEESHKKMLAFYDAFIQLQKEILGIEADDDGMEVEDSFVSNKHTIFYPAFL